MHKRQRRTRMTSSQVDRKTIPTDVPSNESKQMSQVSLLLASKPVGPDISREVIAMLSVDHFGTLSLTSRAYRDTIRNYLSRSVTLDVCEGRGADRSMSQLGCFLVLRHSGSLQQLSFACDSSVFGTLTNEQQQKYFVGLILKNKDSLRKI